MAKSLWERSSKDRGVYKFYHPSSGHYPVCHLGPIKSKQDSLPSCGHATPRLGQSNCTGTASPRAAMSPPQGANSAVVQVFLERLIVLVCWCVGPVNSCLTFYSALFCYNKQRRHKNNAYLKIINNHSCLRKKQKKKAVLCHGGAAHVLIKQRPIRGAAYVKNKYPFDIWTL